MKNIVNASLFFLAAGILTSVSILSVYEVLFSIPLIYYSIFAIKNKEWKLPLSAWFLLAFALIAFLSLIVNLEVVPNPAKNFGRIKYFLYAVGGIYVFRVWLDEASVKTKKFLISTHLVSIIIAGIYAGWQFFYLHKERASGLTETMRYGYGSAMILLLLLSFIIMHKKTNEIFDFKIGVVTLLIGFLGMYLTYTRGALLGFLTGLPFLFYFYKPKLGLRIGTIALIAISILVAFNQMGKGPSYSRFLMSKDNASDGIRKSLWSAAVIAVKEKPVLGWGFGNFHSQLKRIKDDNNLEYKEYNDAHAHNLYLDLSAGTGILGIVLFLGWLVSWAFEAFRSNVFIRTAVVPMGVSFVLSSMFETTLNANIATFIFFIYAISSAEIMHRGSGDIAHASK